MICNDTLECLLVRQAGTEETVSVASRVALPYSWRTQRQPQVSHVIDFAIQLEDATTAAG